MCYNSPAELVCSENGSRCNLVPTHINWQQLVERGGGRIEVFVWAKMEQFLIQILIEVANILYVQNTEVEKVFSATITDWKLLDPKSEATAK